MIHGIETKHNSNKMAIQLDGSKKNWHGFTGFDRNVPEFEFVSQNVTFSFRSRIFVSRVGHEILETIPPTRQ